MSKNRVKEDENDIGQMLIESLEEAKDDAERFLASSAIEALKTA